jgi:hypothetical protein
MRAAPRAATVREVPPSERAVQSVNLLAAPFVAPQANSVQMLQPKNAVRMVRNSVQMEVALLFATRKGS